MGPNLNSLRRKMPQRDPEISKKEERRKMYVEKKTAVKEKLSDIMMGRPIKKPHHWTNKWGNGKAWAVGK